MSRRVSLVCLSVFGAVFSLLLGSVLARVSDTVESTGNKATSGLYGQPYDIQAAQIPFGGNCATATYSQGPVTFTEDANVDLESESTGDTVRYVCIKNAGQGTGQVLVQYTNVTDTEVGTCASVESNPEGGNDQTCADGGAGELKSLLRSAAGSSAPCAAAAIGPNGTFAEMETPRVLSTSLAPGEICRVDFNVALKFQPTEVERSLAQTDRVQWDVRFTLQDVAP